MITIIQSRGIKALTLLFLTLPFKAFPQLFPPNTTTIFSFDCSPKIKFLDYFEDETDYIEFTLWEDILDLNNQGNFYLFNENFHKNDVSGFYIEIKAPGEESSTISITLNSLNDNGTTIDQINNLSLSAVAGSNSTFRSEPILLVMENDEVDDNFDTQPSGTGIPPAWDHTDDLENDPTIHAKMGGKLKASYTNNTDAFVDVCPPNAIKSVTVNVFIMQDATGIPFVDPEIVEAHLKEAETILQQACLQLQVNSIQQVQPTSDYLDDNLMWSDDFETSETSTLISQVKDISNDQKIDLIFVKKLSVASTFGVAIPDFLYNSNNPVWNEDHLRTCIMANESSLGNFIASKLWITVHEMGHILTNHGHYIEDYNDIDPNSQDHPDKAAYNLMIGTGVSTLNTTISSKRIWEFQSYWMRHETDIPQ